MVDRQPLCGADGSNADISMTSELPVKWRGCRGDFNSKACERRVVDRIDECDEDEIALWQDPM
jgi:hypothetical protein